MNERKLRSLDTLVGGETENVGGITELALSLLDPYASHPFRLYAGKRLDDLVESIRESGVMTPIIVRPKQGERYEILSGHNRANASQIAGKMTIPSMIKEGITDGQAKLIVTQTNFFQRGLADMLPSEKAFAFKLELEGLKAERKSQQKTVEIEQFENADIQGVYSKVFQLEHLAKSRDNLAENYGITAADIQRFIRLTHLCRELLDLVDNETVALRAAIPLTHLPENMQREVYRLISEQGCTVDITKAERLKAAYKAGTLNIGDVSDILSGTTKPAKSTAKRTAVHLRPTVVNRYFAQGQSQKEIESTIEKALELYFSSKETGATDVCSIV